MTQESKAPAAASAAASAAAWLECGSGGAYWVMVVLSAVEDMALEKAGDAAGLRQSKTAKASALLPLCTAGTHFAPCAEKEMGWTPSGLEWTGSFVGVHEAHEASTRRARHSGLAVYTVGR
eukprot:COSAG06_NODE_478_length_15216_cov_101.587286_9_plen_121_part_00